MLEIRSPLTAFIKPGDYGTDADKGADLFLSEKAPGTLVQLAGWQDFAEASSPALALLGFDGLGNYRAVRTVAGASCIRIAPDKLLLHHQDNEVLFSSLEKLDPASISILDLSHARWIIEIEGRAVEALLARLAAIDLSLSAFPETTFAQTGIHHIGVLLYRVSVEKFQIFVPVSWIGSLWELICDTARPFAYRIEPAKI